MDALELIAGHAPNDWSSQASPEQLRHFIESREAMMMIVMSADIRASTFIMKEAVDLRYFARIVGHFATSVSNTIRHYRGWFDKFTGDGFLAYWITAERDDATYFDEVLNTANAVIATFRDMAEPALRFNSRNFPARAGISIGLDSGPTWLAEIAGDLTIVGPSVVGAVRMVSAAQPYETLANVFLGERLIKRQEHFAKHGITLRREIRKSKEYPDGQHVYAISLPRVEAPPNSA